MKKTVLFALIIAVAGCFVAKTACAGPEKIILKLVGVAAAEQGMDKEISLDEAGLQFREILIKEFAGQGIGVVSEGPVPTVTVKLYEFGKEGTGDKVVKWALFVTVGGAPWLTNSNKINLRVFIKDWAGKPEFELKEFTEYRENMKDWDEMRKAVAQRIAEAIFFLY